MSTTKEKVADAVHAVGDKAKEVGQKIGEGVSKATEFVKDKIGLGGPAKAVADIQPQMPVVASCGSTIGKVDHMQDGAIKLTKNDSPDGQHHFIPTDWVERVDGRVHLNKNSMEATRDWKADAASCSC